MDQYNHLALITDVGLSDLVEAGYAFLCGARQYLGSSFDVRFMNGTDDGALACVNYRRGCSALMIRATGAVAVGFIRRWDGVWQPEAL